MACAGVPHVVIHIFCSTRTYWGNFWPSKGGGDITFGGKIITFGGQYPYWGQGFIEGTIITIWGHIIKFWGPDY